MEMGQNQTLSNYINNEIYQSFLKKIGNDWYIPYNINKFMTCGEFTICEHLHQIGLLIRVKENNVFKFKTTK